VTELINDPESDCPEGGTPIMVDGASGSVCHTLVALATAKRGYLIRLYISDDHPSLVEQYDRTWFQGLLATVRLHPADAVDGPAASSTPGPS
jgi:hypothetical protein